jgi:hypothetical protein
MIEQVEAEQICRTDKGREELQNSYKKTIDYKIEKKW